MIVPDLSAVSATGRVDLVSYRKNSPAVGWSAVRLKARRLYNNDLRAVNHFLHRRANGHFPANFSVTGLGYGLTATAWDSYYDVRPAQAGVAKLVYAPDSKSGARKGMSVRVRPPAPSSSSHPNFH
jgi:hypothetical protein